MDNTDVIIANPLSAGQAPKRRPERGPLLPDSTYDPVRHFIAAYAYQAVVDYFYPPHNLAQKHRLSAAEFVHSEDGRQLLTRLNITPEKIAQVLGEK